MKEKAINKYIPGDYNDSFSIEIKSGYHAEVS